MGRRWPSRLKYLLGIKFEKHIFSSQKTNVELSFVHHL